MRRHAPADDGGYDDGGYVALEWAAGVALLVVPVLLLVVAASSWSAHHEAAAAAARAGARSAAAAARLADAAPAAHRAVDEVLRDRSGSNPPTSVQVQVEVEAEGGRPVVGPHLPRNGRVSVTVRLPTPAAHLPGVGAIRGPTVSATHVRVLDPLRTR